MKILVLILGDQNKMDEWIFSQAQKQHFRRFILHHPKV
jgi:hypothetical protein